MREAAGTPPAIFIYKGGEKVADINLFTPSDVEIQEIANEVSKIMNNEFKETTEVTWNSLIESAKFFIQRYDQISNFSININQFDILKNAMGLVKKSNEQLVLIQACYAYAFWFDEQLKRFRGQAPSSALFILEDRRNMVPSTYEIPILSLIKYINAADKNRLNASHTLLKQELDGVKKELLIDPDHVLHAQSAYKGVANRLEEYWKKVGGQRQDGLLMWKEDHEWVVAKVLNKGDLKEAYAAALMIKHKSKMDKLCNIDIGSPKYYSHDLVKVFFNEHITKVSNAAAIQEEDIVMSDKQYGVKSFRAEMPSLAQYYNAAKWVVANKDIAEKELKQELENELRKGGESFRNKIVGKFNENVNESIDEMIEKARTFGKK